MNSKEIIMAMGTGDIRNTTLQNELSKYIAICQIEVDDIIRDGVTDKREKLFGYVLGLKRFYPANWRPVEQPREIKAKQLVFGLSTDRTVKNKVTGKDHFNYKNGSGIAEQNRRIKLLEKKHGLQDYNEKRMKPKYEYSGNTSRCKEIIHTLGGTSTIALITNTSGRTVRDWPFLTKNGTQGYFPRKYIDAIVKFSLDYDLGVTRKDLEELLPEIKLG